jgi:hypothetical protein
MMYFGTAFVSCRTQPTMSPYIHISIMTHRGEEGTDSSLGLSPAAPEEDTPHSSWHPPHTALSLLLTNSRLITFLRLQPINILHSGLDAHISRMDSQRPGQDSGSVLFRDPCLPHEVIISIWITLESKKFNIDPRLTDMFLPDRPRSFNRVNSLPEHYLPPSYSFGLRSTQERGSRRGDSARSNPVSNPWSSPRTRGLY